MIEIYGLTEAGKRAARNVRNPNTPEWRIIHYLDLARHATKEQVAQYAGLPQGVANKALRNLQRVRPPLVEEETGNRR